MEKKYVMTDESIEIGNDKKAYRIKALKNFSDVKVGDFGGYIESEYNLSHEGTCWIYDNAVVFDYARVFDDAKVTEKSKVFGESRVCEEALIYGESKIYGRATVRGYSIVAGKASVYGNDVVEGIEYKFESEDET